MSKRALTHEGMRSLALRCEEAKTDRCRCRCGGELHGQKHNEEWIDSRERNRQPDQIDWVGYEGFEQYL
jgi:hypothetical protein